MLNNLSKLRFKSFLGLFKEYEPEQLNKRNGFLLGGKKGGFCCVSDLNEVYCRQFYEDYELLVVDYNEDLYFIDRHDLIIDPKPNRISVNGYRSYTATADKKDMNPIQSLVVVRYAVLCRETPHSEFKPVTYFKDFLSANKAYSLAKHGGGPGQSSRLYKIGLVTGGLGVSVGQGAAK